MNKRKRILIATGICMAAAALVVAGLAIWHPWSAQSGQPSANASLSTESYPLSGWARFDECWEKTSEDDGIYSEVDEGGNIAYYRLRDGYEPGAGIEGATVLREASRAASGEEGDIVVVDCSTGEVSHWVLAGEAREALESDDADADALAANGIYKEDDVWLAYENVPVNTSTDDYSGQVLTGWATIEETAEKWMEKLPDEDKKIVLENSPRLREYLIEHYGEEVVAPYED